MTTAKPDKQRVFLSSGFKEFAGDRWIKLPLRERIIAAHEQLPVDLWAYELGRWRDSDEGNPQLGVDTIVDRCFAGIRDCDLFVFLLMNRHGSGAAFLDDHVQSSYLELELFAAAILQKPVLVLHRRGQEPEPALRDTLDLLHRTFPAGQYVIDDDEGLYRRFFQECDRLASKGRLAPEPILSRLADWLASKRSRSTFTDELLQPSLSFLDGRFRSSRLTADPNKAKLLLDQVASGIRGQSREVLPHGAALFRLWAAMRELMDDHERTIADPTLAPLWDRAFGMWASHASWFPLHGHLWMGPLSAVHSQIALRRKFATEPAFRAADDVREPLGARASAVYSIARVMHSRRSRLVHYRLAGVLATEAVPRDPDAKQGALLIRGHASMRMAQLGYVWKLWSAAGDIQETLVRRERAANASDASIGEAKVSLGFVTILLGRPRAGLCMMQEGVALMRSDTSADGLAFLARGLRTLEQGARICLRRNLAESAREERMRVATSVEAMDQSKEL